MSSRQKYARPKLDKILPVEEEIDDPIIGSLKFPHNSENILKDADPPISLFSHNLTQQLRSGVFLKPKKLIKYWIDERNINYFMLFPRMLSIIWSDHSKYWTWFPTTESPNETIVENVKMKHVCWLDITGKFDTKNLTPGIEYEVVFKVKLEESATGWNTPVNVKLILPNGYKNKPLQEQKVNMKNLPRSHWIDVKAGEFVQEKSVTGEINFSMYEHNKTGIWKSGLILKGVVISPKSIN